MSRVAWAHDAKLLKTFTLVRAAAAAGALPSLEWLHRHANHSWPNDYDACHSAAKHGHLNTLKWLVRTARAQWMPNVVVDAAAKNGHLDCLKWAMHHGCENPRHILPEVARNGHTDVVEFLWIHNASGHVMEAVMAAAEQGHMDVLRMFHRHNLRWGREPKEAAASCGQLEALQFLVKYDLTLPSNAQELHHEDGWMEACLWHAAKEGHTNVLEWLVGFGREIDVHMCVFAARKGRINVLEWILNRGHRDLLLEADVLQCAQHFQQTDVVAWLRAHGMNINVRQVYELPADDGEPPYASPEPAPARRVALSPPRSALLAVRQKQRAAVSALEGKIGELSEALQHSRAKEQAYRRRIIDSQYQCGVL